MSTHETKVIEEGKLRKGLSRIPAEFGMIHKTDVSRMIDKLLEEEQAHNARMNNLAFDMIKWERDVAISQLNDIGVQFGEKVDDVVRVIRCKNCTYSEESLREGSVWCMRRASDDSDVRAEIVGEDHFCSYGERR